MARSIDQQLSALKSGDVSLDELRKALRSGRGMLVAAAAKRVADDRRDTLAPDLAAAFPMLGDAKADPQCRGKLAIAKAMHALEEWDDRVFVAGLRVVQIEGFGREDTAGTLRGACGIAHVHFGMPNALDVLAMLLADPDRSCRNAAAQAVGDSRRSDASALLRYKLLVGDDEPEVLASCFESLFAIARDASAEFASEMLARTTDDRAEAAALALGSLRIESAVEALAEWCETSRPERRHRVGYVALALLRNDAANAILLRAIATQPRDAVAAARALATFKDDPAIVAAVREASSELDAPTRKEIEGLLAR